MIVNGVDFGVFTIAEEDWKFISDICKREKYKTVLEFGGGVSTVWFSEIMEKVQCIETDASWAEKIKQAVPDSTVIYPQTSYVLGTCFDLVFVDGPFFSNERWSNVELAGLLPGVRGVVLHDSHEPWILEYGAEYLAKNGFTHVEFGGSVYIADPPGAAPYEGRFRCTHWKRQGDKNVNSK